jgi:hypothetical protein
MKFKIAKVWEERTFDKMQSVFHNWMIRLASAIENRGEYAIKKYEMVSSHVTNLKIGGGALTFFTP